VGKTGETGDSDSEQVVGKETIQGIAKELSERVERTTCRYLQTLSAGARACRGYGDPKLSEVAKDIDYHVECLATLAAAITTMLDWIGDSHQHPRPRAERLDGSGGGGPNPMELRFTRGG
jgi:hypothetical protein